MAERKKKKIRGSNRREIICISAILVVLLGVMMVQSSQLKEKNAGYVEQIAELEEQIQEESERAEELDQLEEDVKTPEYAGEIAKERLGLVGEDEILFRAED